MPDNSGRYRVNEETPRQQVSNRSILRVQQLSNELKQDLSRMGFFECLSSNPEKEVIKQVLFVACDHRHQTTELWYNFRLCASYGFDQAAFEKLQENQQGVKDLFALANEFDPQTTASYAQFKDALAKERVALEGSDVATFNGRKAMDHLLIALATIPYRGLLPDLLEKQFLPELGDKELKSDACFFRPDITKKFETLRFDKLKLKKNFKQERLELDPLKIKTSKKVLDLTLVTKLFDKFLLSFTRGAWDRIEHNADEERSVADIFGFAFPAYDTWTEKNGWQGGLVGWVVVFLDPDYSKSIEGICSPSEENETTNDFLKHSWVHLTNLLRAYVRRVREANIRDLLEDYADPFGAHVPPRDFFLQHLHQVIGFKTQPSDETQDIEEKVPKDVPKRLVIPEDTHREQVEQNVIPLIHTRWDGCDDRSENNAFPPGTRRLCAMFLDELDLVRAKREEGRQTGIREDRERHEFMWAHETRKLSRALVQCGEAAVRDLIGRHLVAMTYPARGEPTRLSEENDLKQYWPSPYSVLFGTAKEWMHSIHDFSARRFALTSYALGAATQGSNLEKQLDEFCESSLKDVQWCGIWEQLRIDDTFPAPARKFFTRLWLAAFSNYFKHLETATAKPPCMLEIRESDFDGILLISHSNILGKAPDASGKELGTKDILIYDLLNAARWRDAKRSVPIFGQVHEQDLIELVKFETLSAPAFSLETRFVTQVPIPRTFFT